MREYWSPLWSRIVLSTLWSESKDVKILYVTMLALKDSKGEVAGTTVGLAKLAGLTYEEAVEALRVLESPDTKSDTNQEYEGRRIRRMDGGWKILNHDKYQAKLKELNRQTYQAQWIAGQRAITKAIETGESIDPSMLNASQLKRYQSAMEKERKRREKKIERDGACAGAREAIQDGLDAANERSQI